MIVGICSTFFATGQFEGEEFQASANWIRMKHKVRKKFPLRKTIFVVSIGYR